jgi:hypothetical protein
MKISQYKRSHYNALDAEEMNTFPETRGHVPTNGDSGAFRYGTLTSPGLDAVVVSTTHAGVLDSE